MVYPVSFAQETGRRIRLDVDAVRVAVEHVCTRIGVSTGFCRVRSSALGVARTGENRTRAHGAAARRSQVRGEVGGRT